MRIAVGGGADLRRHRARVCAQHGELDVGAADLAVRRDGNTLKLQPIDAHRVCAWGGSGNLGVWGVPGGAVAPQKRILIVFDTCWTVFF